jgi:hypothetical protein
LRLHPERGGGLKLDGIREDRPIMDALLPAKVRLRTPNCICQRSSFDCERGLARAMLVSRVIANCFDKTYIE